MVINFCFKLRSDLPETFMEIIFRLAMVDVTHQEEIFFELVNLNAVKWPATASFKYLPSVQMTTDVSHDTVLQPMSNHSIELTGRLVNSHEECFS